MLLLFDDDNEGGKIGALICVGGVDKFGGKDGGLIPFAFD